MMSMVSRERVLAAINHEKTDRAPANYGAHAEVTDALIQKLGLADREELLQAFHVDIRHIGAGYRLPDSEMDGERVNMWGVRRRRVKASPDQFEVVYPFNEDTTMDDVFNHPWPDPNSLDYSQVKGACEKYHGEYALVGSPWSPFFHEVGWTIGQENFFVWMYTKKGVLKAIIDHVVDYEIEATRRFLEAADGSIDITYFGNDYGTQRGLVVSPDSWNEFLRGPQKRYFDVSHDFQCKVMFHSCGAVRDIIPDLMEDGVDILDPVQVQAAGMNLAGLAADFGGSLSFHGAVDTQKTLPFGSEEDVRQQVRSYLNLFRSTGGYMLCGSQLYIEDIPLENILAVYDENLKSEI